MKQAIISAFLGRLRDRFCEYQEPLTHRSETGMHGPDPGRGRRRGGATPTRSDTAEVMKGLLQRLGLGVAAVNVNIKADPVFAYGSLTSPDRRSAARPSTS